MNKTIISKDERSCSVRNGKRSLAILLKVLIMTKLTCFLIFLFSTSAWASVFSQKINISGDHLTFRYVIEEIQRQTNLSFAIKDRHMKSARNLNLSLQDADLDEALSSVFRNQPFNYEVEGRFVITKDIVKASKPTSDSRKNGLSVQDDIRGRVTDTLGHPIQGATIRVIDEHNRRTRMQAFSDKEGYFSLEAIPTHAKLEISCVGYLPVRASAGENMGVVELQISHSLLDELVLTGYRESSARLNTGTVSTIKSSEITGQPIANPLSALSGRVSGLSVTQSNGLPGGGFDIKIRGNNSLQSGSSPLFIIDGVPFANESLNEAGGTAGANGGISPFSMINPSDIERIDVLKDADATAIYGVRGSNGVVLITTKRGKTGASKLDVNYYHGRSKVSHYIPMLNTQQYLDLRREALANDGITPDEDNAPDLLLYAPDKYTDWQKELIGGTASVNDVQATFSGGSDAVRFLVNANYRKEGTVYRKPMGNERIGARMNLDYGAAESRFSATFSAAFSHDKTNLTSVDLTAAYVLPPNYPGYNPDGSLYYDAAVENNPYAFYDQKYHGLTNSLLGNTTLKYRPLDNLLFKVNLGYNQTTLDQNNTYPTSSFNPITGETNQAVFANGRMTNVIAEPTVDYTVDAESGKWNFLAGASWQTNSAKQLSIRGMDYSSEALLESALAAGSIYPLFENIDKYHYSSFFGRISYNKNGRYLANVNYRHDGSSKFGENNRFGDFGSIGAAWVFSEETFAKEALSFLSFGKLRASFGITGNDKIGNYLYLPLYTNAGSYEGQSALRVTEVYNPDIHWEYTRKTEFGLNLGFLHDRLLFGANYFIHRSDDQIVYMTMPTQTGFNTFAQNIDAEIRNTGLEIDVTSVNMTRGRFTWNTNFNITFNRNKLISFPGLEESFYKDLYLIGQPINVQRYYQFSHIDAGNGAIVYQDTEGGGIPDYLPGSIGNPFFGGIANTLVYGNWSLDFLVQFVHQNGLTNSLSDAYGYATVLGEITNQNLSVLDRWRQPGDSGTLFPGASTTPGSDIYDSYDFFSGSNRFFGDASFLRFKSLNLQYSLDKNIVKKMGLSALGIYVQGSNLFTLMKNKYVFDPEVQSMGVGTMPALRTFTLGVNCSF